MSFIVTITFTTSARLVVSGMRTNRLTAATTIIGLFLIHASPAKGKFDLSSKPSSMMGVNSGSTAPATLAFPRKSTDKLCSQR
ncbi:hypothetical protein O3P69_017189 [Scylla paramamosain]|uniref:Secreted protein n=1 Tax=Scylla paramamosain TaxID=85552 RepID=A0AAW0TWF1_SCYPA